ncbi:hypothetical protein [Sunxiuqinia dokdonensis]|nr:hypothetical protein [Sunxiuqinia dokdonensis]
MSYKLRTTHPLLPLRSNKGQAGIENKENVAALRMLKRINLLATSTMIVSILFLLWAIMGLAKVKRRIGRGLRSAV